MTRTKTDGLTEREREVVLLLAVGKSGREIAEELKIHIKTFDSHRSQALKKLNLKNTVELARHALRVGWVKL